MKQNIRYEASDIDENNPVHKGLKAAITGIMILFSFDMVTAPKRDATKEELDTWYKAKVAEYSAYALTSLTASNVALVPKEQDIPNAFLK